jgi:hypothetical protein
MVHAIASSSAMRICLGIRKHSLSKSLIVRLAILFTSARQAAVIGKLAGTKAALSEDSERPDRMAGEAWSGHPSETSLLYSKPGSKLSENSGLVREKPVSEE